MPLPIAIADCYCMVGGGNEWCGLGMGGGVPCLRVLSVGGGVPCLRVSVGRSVGRILTQTSRGKNDRMHLEN